MIKQAIIPLAGLGTRLLPLTSVLPKELLPINGRPALDYILDECLESGIKEIILIISKKKKMIKDYFYKDHFYKKIIKMKSGDKRLKLEYARIKKLKKMIKFVYQNSPKGTGDALLKCEKHIKSKHFLLLLPDDLILKRNCSQDMIKLYKKYGYSIIASKKVKSNDVSRWGIFNCKKFIKNNFFITNVIEKPSKRMAPSNYAVIGRYILPKNIFKILKKQKAGQNGEVHVTDAIKKLIDSKNKFVGHIFSGKYLDCGTLKGYVNSTLDVSKLKI